MDQLKAFVGMAIFLSQMATGPGITSVSNSAPISALCKSWREMDPLSFCPHSAGRLMEGKRAAVTEHVISYILLIPLGSFHML